MKLDLTAAARQRNQNYQDTVYAPGGLTASAKIPVQSPTPSPLSVHLELARLIDSTQTLETPFLYYFSQGINAIVVEPADGTESRLLAEGIMPPETNEIIGAEWSASGEWFLCHSTVKDNHGQASIFKPWAFSADGLRRATVLDDYVTARLWWSPADDLLFAVGIIDTGEEVIPGGFFTYRLALIDPEADAILASVNVQLVHGISETISPAFRQLRWTADGKYIFFQYQENVDGNPPLIFQVFDVAAHTITTKLALTSLLSGYIQQPALSISPFGVVVYDNNGQILVHNALGGAPYLESVALPRVSSIVWNDDGSLAVIASEVGITLVRLEAGAALQTETLSPASTDILLSPDGNAVLFHDGQSQIHVVDLVTGDTSILSLSGGARWENAFQIHIQRDDGMHYLVDPKSNAILAEARLPEDATDGWFSYSGHYIAGMHFGESPYIVDLITGDQTTISPHSTSPEQSDYDGFVDWHPTEDWFITRELPFVPMMGGDPYRTAVVSADGSVRRELPYCYDPANCAQWLPPQVDPSMLKPIQED